MQKILAALLVCVCVTAFAQEKKYKVGVVGFYNLENLYDTIDDPKTDDAEFLPAGPRNYGTAIYTDKINKLAEVVSSIGTEVTPDGVSILGVAEIENDKVLQDLAAHPKLKSRNYKIVHYDSPDLRGVDVGLYYNPKYFKVTHSEPLFVRLENPDGSLHYTRDVLWVAGIYDGEPMHVFVNHWPSRRGGEEASEGSRAAAAAVCKKVIDSLMKVDPKTKVFVMGDLNDDPVSPSVTKVIGAKGSKDKVNEGGMYNPWVDFYKNGIGTLAYNDSWNLFDQIMLSYGFLDKHQSGFFFHQAHIFKKEYMVTKTGRYKGYPMRTFDGLIYNGGYSDHFPTYTVLLKEVKTP